MFLLNTFCIHEHLFNELRGSVFLGCFAFKMALESNNQKHQVEKVVIVKKRESSMFCKCFHATYSEKTIWLLEVAMGSMKRFCGITFYFLVWSHSFKKSISINLCIYIYPYPSIHTYICMSTPPHSHTPTHVFCKRLSAPSQAGPTK